MSSRDVGGDEAVSTPARSMVNPPQDASWGDAAPLVRRWTSRGAEDSFFGAGDLRRWPVILPKQKLGP